MLILMSSLAVSLVAATGTIQVGGGSATFGNQQGRSGADAARAAELAKRSIPYGDGKYLDASVLMNVEADEYVATFGISHEGKTLEDAQRKMDAATRGFSVALTDLKIPAANFHVDFVAQNRIYGYDSSEPNILKEAVVGFEVKKNIAVRYKDKTLLDRITAAASRSGIFDLVKVDYVIRDMAPIRRKLLEEAMRVIKMKVEEQEALLGFKVGQLSLTFPPLVNAYYPTEMYESYTAQESEEMLGYRPNVNILRARKPRTFFYSGLSPKDFDATINPTPVEPMVQVTAYIRVKH